MISTTHGMFAVPTVRNNFNRRYTGAVKPRPNMSIIHAHAEDNRIIAWDENGYIWTLKQTLNSNEQALNLVNKVLIRKFINLELWTLDHSQESCVAMCVEGNWMKSINGETVIGGKCACCKGKGYMNNADRVRKVKYEHFGRTI